MKKKIISSLLMMGFIFYTGFVIWNILFKYAAPWELLNSSRYCSRTLNLIPFNDIIEGHYNKLDIWGNMILFMPLGIYLSLAVKEIKYTHIIWCALTVSFGFEALQYILGLGASDVTDLITNTLGAVAGWGIYRGIKKLLKSDEDKIKTLVTVCSMVVMVPVAAVVVLIYLAN